MAKSKTTYHPNLTNSEIKKISSLLIRKARNHLSQTNINLKLGHSSNYCAKWERGDIRIDFDTFLKILKWGKLVEWSDIKSRAYLINPYLLIDDVYYQQSKKHGPNSSRAQKFYRLKTKRNVLTLNDVVEVLSLKDFLPGILMLFWGEEESRPELVKKIISIQLKLASRSKKCPLINIVRDFISLPVYIKQLNHSDLWMSQQLKIPVKTISKYLQILMKSGEIEWKSNKYIYKKRYTYVDSRAAQERWHAFARWFKFLETFSKSFVQNSSPPEEEAISELGFALSPVSNETLNKIVSLQQEFRLRVNSLITNDPGPPDHIVFYIDVVAQYLHLVEVAGKDSPDFLSNIFSFPENVEST